MSTSETRLVICEMTEDWQKTFLQERFGKKDPDIDLSFFESPLQHLNPPAVEQAELLSVFIDSDCSAERLRSFSHLQMITTRSTGYDHIDLRTCRERDIVVSNVPTYGEHTVAEHTFALMLNLSRRVHEVVQQTRRGEFEFGGVRGFDLRGKTLGVIGTGHIGKHVIKMARGFGMEVVAHDVDEDAFTAELLGYEYVPLEELLAQSNIITLHVPLNEKTRHLIDRQELERCRNDALIINTARGGLINTSVLHEMLQNDQLGGAGLDVIEGEEMILSESELNEKDFSREKLEQLVENNRLLRRDDVIFTPHMAYNSREAVERILSTTVENITSYLDGQPQNTVTT